MFKYEKFLQRPIKISKPNPRLANIVITQYGGPYRKSLADYARLSRVFMPRFIHLIIYPLKTIFLSVALICITCYN